MTKISKKTGKSRLDKYYKLAKEQGYRARSAFKLIQLNKKYSFLESARCCIDLCAAPGGWLQVASKYMPVNSVIVGVDLVPIKPIPRVVTFVSDITTPHCRSSLHTELKDWKADVVLHDGAPNVGTAWIQDAYSQSELVLMSLKLAVEFLAKGGTFVTKVFRSVDYNSLLWVFNQLFGKVEATKPPSSRNVSAEIFVVCRQFRAPKYIDPKFLDPKHVFKDVAASASLDLGNGPSLNNAHTNVFQPDKKRRRRDGYEEGDYTLFKKISAGDFVKGPDPITALGTANKISFETAEEQGWLDLAITTTDVKANVEDLKVLGKSDFKVLLKWRLALRQELGLDVRRTEVEEVTEVVEVTDDVDEEVQISEELQRLHTEALLRAKRERRRANENKTRAIQRMQLQMTAPLDIGLEQHDASLATGQDDIFDLEGAENALGNYGISELLGGDNTVSDTENEAESRNESEADADDVAEQKVTTLEDELDRLYDAYQHRLRERDAKAKVKHARQKNPELRAEWHGIKDDSDEEDDAELESDGWETLQHATKDLVDRSSSEDESDSSDSAPPVLEHRKRQRDDYEDDSMAPPKRSRLVTNLANRKSGGITRAAQVWFNQDVFSGVEGLDDFEDENHEEPHNTVSEAKETDCPINREDDIEIVPQESKDDDMWAIENENEVGQAVEEYGLVTPEAVTLAQQLVNRQKTKTQLVNDGFSRYSLNSKEGLPTWFIDEEAKFYKPNIPITKEAVAALRAKQRALDARPIKKVAEAKARKKLKAQQRLAKAMKKAEGINATSDMTEREKVQQIEKLLRRGASNAKTKKDVKVVVAKGPHKGLKGRPKGVKGRYVMVDSRMKKEVRAKKRMDKASRKRRHP